MKSIGLCLFLVMHALSVWAYKGRVLDAKANPIIGATASVYREDVTIQLMAVTDTLGYYHLDVAHYPILVKIQSLGYKPQEVSIHEEPDNVVETVLEEDEFLLNEVVVTPEMMQHYESHTTYRISQKEMANYANFAQALNVVPFITVTSSGSMSYKGNSDIVILLNGVQTTWAEIQALDKGDVSKVDVYENPPAQYALAGATSVINIITKRNVTGGNLSWNLRDAFHPVYGNNSFAAFYNYGQSRFSLLMNNSMAHYKKVQTDETLHYTFDGEAYFKQKKGYDSPQSRDNNSFALGYMTSRPDHYQFNANLSTTLYEQEQKKGQFISYGETESLNGERNLYNKYNKYALNLYFNKRWEEGKSLLADITGTLYDTRFRSDYIERVSLEDILFESHSAYTTKRRSLLSTLQYTVPSSWGQWTLGARDTYQSAKQHEEKEDFSQNQHTLYGYAQLYGKKNIFYYQLILAAKYLNIQERRITAWHKWYPAPSVKLWLRPKKNITFQLSYRYTADVPSVSLMSETEQWLDNLYVYKGNSALKPYSIHHIDLAGSISTRHLDFSFQGLYNDSPDAIVNHFEATSRYILQTYTNLQAKKEIGGQVVIDYFPLNDKSLKIGAVGIYIHHQGKEKDGITWNGYRYQLMGYISYALPKWDFEVYYQYPEQTLDGQLVTPRAEMLRIDAAYKPLPTMSIGLQWNQPFMKGFTEEEHTTETCLIQSTSSSNIRDYANMICLKFSYNFSFGKQKKHSVQRVKNEDTDSGLLIK